MVSSRWAGLLAHLAAQLVVIRSFVLEDWYQSARAKVLHLDHLVYHFAEVGPARCLFVLGTAIHQSPLVDCCSWVKAWVRRFGHLVCHFAEVGLANRQTARKKVVHSSQREGWQWSAKAQANHLRHLEYHSVRVVQASLQVPLLGVLPSLLEGS